jgi:hypothetical protein
MNFVNHWKLSSGFVTKTDHPQLQCESGMNQSSEAEAASSAFKEKKDSCTTQAKRLGIHAKPLFLAGHSIWTF